MRSIIVIFLVLLASTTAFGQVTITAKDAELSAILQEFSQKTKVVVSGQVPAENRTVDCSGKPEDVIRCILKTNFSLVFLDGKLDEVKLVPYSKTTQIVTRISYGEGEAQLKVVHTSTGGIGPASFSASAGKVYILDILNNCVKIFSNAGAFLGSIPIPDAPFASDLAGDPDGNVYVYYSSIRELLQIAGTGTVRARLQLKPKWKGIVRFRVQQDNVISYACTLEGCRDFIIGKLKGGVLTQPTAEEAKDIDGVLGLSGRTYRQKQFIDRVGVTFIERVGVTYEVNDHNVKGELSLQLAGLVGAEILGEDEAGNLYVWTLTDEGALKSEVHKIKDGAIQESFPLPHVEIGYGGHIFKGLDPSRGQIFQFCPEKESASLVTTNIQTEGRGGP